jgi:hypothetical protein
MAQARAPIFDERDLLDDLAYVYTDLGTSHRILDEAAPGVRIFHRCVHLRRPAWRSTRAGDGLHEPGQRLLQPQPARARARQEHRAALRIAVRGDDKHLLGQHLQQCRAGPGNVGTPTTRRIEAYEYALTMSSAKDDDQTGVSACYNNLGSVCFARGDFAQARTWYTLDMALLRKRGAWTDLAATLHNLGHVALEQDDLAQAPPISPRAAICTRPSISAIMCAKKKICCATRRRCAQTKRKQSVSGFHADLTLSYLRWRTESSMMGPVSTQNGGVLTGSILLTNSKTLYMSRRLIMNLKPLGDRIVVEPVEQEEQTAFRHFPARDGQGEAAAGQGDRIRPGRAQGHRRTHRDGRQGWRQGALRRYAGTTSSWTAKNF